MVLLLNASDCLPFPEVSWWLYREYSLPAIAQTLIIAKPSWLPVQDARLLSKPTDTSNHSVNNLPVLCLFSSGVCRVLIGSTSVVEATVAQVIGLVKDRVNFVPELWEQANFFFVAPTEYDEKSLAKRWKEDSPRHMTELLAVLEGIDENDWTTPAGKTAEEGVLNTVVMNWIAEHEYGVGIVMNAFRICLVGAARGPHIWAITDILGKAETLRRVRQALSAIK